MAFYELMFSDCKPAEATGRYAGSEYKQFSSNVAGGKQAFIDAKASMLWWPHNSVIA